LPPAISAFSVYSFLLKTLFLKKETIYLRLKVGAFWINFRKISQIYRMIALFLKKA